MSTISMSFYALKFKVKNTRGTDFEDLDDIQGMSTNAVGKKLEILENIESFLSKLPRDYGSKVDPNKNSKKDIIYLKENSLTKSGRSISGILSSGDKGYSSTLVNEQSGAVNYSRKTNDLELLPFYFLFDIPKGKKVAILALQSFGVHGIAFKFNSDLKEYLKAIYPEYTVYLHVIHIGGLFAEKYVENGRIRSIEGTRYFAPKDLASKNSAPVKCIFAYSPIKRGEFFGTGLNRLLSQFMKAKNPSKNEFSTKVNELLSIDVDNIIDLKFLIDISGATRKLNIGNPENSITKYDLTEDVKKHQSGHPIFAGLDKLTKEIISNDIRGIIKI